MTALRMRRQTGADATPGAGASGALDAPRAPRALGTDDSSSDGSAHAAADAWAFGAVAYKVTEHSSAEGRGGPHVAISPAMLRPSDAWAFGAVAHKLLTGCDLFYLDSADGILSEPDEKVREHSSRELCGPCYGPLTQSSPMLTKRCGSGPAVIDMFPYNGFY